MSTTAATILVYSGGLEIDSCMDPAIQAIVEEIYSNQENMILPSKSGQNLQSAIVIVDPDGNIVALAGALGEKERNRVWNYASRSQRQPGSSIKPLSVYAPALEMGLVTPNSVFDDTPVQELNGSAWPRNSYLSYKGRMNVYDAVRMSSNAVAVRVFQTVGAEGSFQFMEDRFHIGLVESRDGSSDLGPAQLALGGLTDGVSPRDMATAYSVFPRNGKYVASRTYTQVRDSNGKVLLDTTEQKPEFVLKESTVWYMNYMLQSVVNGGSGSTGREARFDGMSIAGKTGSTNSNNDRWFVGYTPYYTAAVWCGYDTPERINAGNSNLGPAAFHPPVHLINVVPFVWIQETYQMGFARMIEQLLLNIVMFVPLGFLTPVCFPKFRPLRPCLLSLTGYSLTIEILQFFIGRSADIDDLIMNTLGGILGWLIFCAVRRTQPGREKLLKDFSE